jgi:zinc transport system ATP-binding protein
MILDRDEMPPEQSDLHKPMTSAEPVEPGEPVVQMRGGAVGYDHRPAILDIDFTLRSGEVTVLLGPNGAGKSTLVRGILGLAPLMAGTLELFGTPATRFRARHRIGYVPQRHTIVGGVPATVSEVVASGRLPRRRPFVPARTTDRTAVRAAMATVGLAGHAGSSVAALSGGQQRRVLIARALAADPEVLVMDEPTAGVDTTTQHLLAGTLADLTRAGRTLLLVAHELGPLEPLIGRVVVMRDGRITYDGPPVAGGEGTYHQHDPTAHDHHHLPEHTLTRPTVGGPWPGAAPFDGTQHAPRARP